MITWITRKKWSAVGVSKVGIAHVQADVPCQDACRALVESGTLIACAADGAGSSRHSDKGSRAAVDAFVAASQARLESTGKNDLAGVVSHAFEESRKAVQDIAAGDIREYSTTLLGVIATRGALAAGQVGDGAIIVDGEVVLDSHSGEYANETRFLTGSNVDPNIYTVSAGVRRVAILTDGLENLALADNGYQRTPHEPFFEPMYKWLQDSVEAEREAQLGEFLVSERVRSRTTDDVTLLLAIR